MPLEQLEISGGNKGNCDFDAKVKSADVDIHSSYGRYCRVSSWYLIQALTSLRAADGRILVEGLYDDVQEPNERESWPWLKPMPNAIQRKSARFMAWNYHFTRGTYSLSQTVLL